VVLAGAAMAGVATLAPAGQSTSARDDSGPVGLFSGSTPSTQAAEDRAAVEVGMRFSSSRDAEVVGAQVYKAARAASRTPTQASLWNGNGRRLARVDLPATSGTGWVTARFSEPVSIKADKTYTVSVYAPRGRYAATRQGFRNDIRRNGLTAPGGDENGVYRYGTGGGFPQSTWNAANYFVDVVFRPSS